MANTITQLQIDEVASSFGIESALVKTVLDVESRGSGFLPSGRVKILFEAHVFGRLTGYNHNQAHPTISAPNWTEGKKYYKGGEGEWIRLTGAAKLNRDAAFKSASWGLGQIMGENYKAAGYTSAENMAVDFGKSEVNQLKGMMKFIQSNPKMFAALKAKDWATFARLYNGPGYAVNKYDFKLASTYSSIAKVLGEAKKKLPNVIIIIALIIAIIIVFFWSKKEYSYTL